MGALKEVKLTERAQRNHDELFPNHRSVLRDTDPEFIEVFDNWAFDEVLAQSKFDAKTRILLTLGSVIGAQAVAEYKVMVGAALDVDVTPVEIKEVLYQSVPYVGIAKAFDFLHATNEVLTSRGVSLPLEGQSTTTRETRRNKGRATQKEIFGSAIDRMVEQSPKDQLHIQEFLAANCFGDYYTRTGLSLKTRELLTLSILIALGGTEPQIKGHIRGNLNLGNDRELLISLITQLLPWVGYPRALTALACLNEIAPFQPKS